MDELKNSIQKYYTKMFKKLNKMGTDDNVSISKYRSVVRNLSYYWVKMFGVTKEDKHYIGDEFALEGTSAIIIEGISMIYNYIAKQMMCDDPVIQYLISNEINTIIDKYQNYQNVKMAITKMKIKNINRDFRK